MSHRVLITGPSGAGKTYISSELRKRGINAVDADLVEGLSGWFDGSGKEVQIPDDADQKNLDNHEFLWNREILNKFLKNQREIYFFGMSGNAFEMLDLFDKVYFLKASPDLLTERLRHESRENPMGRTDFQLQNALNYAKNIEVEAKNLGIEMIAANQTTEEILAKIK